MRAAFLLLALVLLSTTGWTSPLLYGPWSGAPEAEAVTISWASSPASEARVEYGPLADHEGTGWLLYEVVYTPSAPASREIAHARLDGLDPATWYAYRIVFPDGTASATGTFRTAPLPGESVAFAVISDTQWQWEGVNRIQRVGDALASDPTPFGFILHAGDLVESPVSRYWEHLFSSLSRPLLRAPFLPVLGNHERNSVSYYQHFALPPGGGQAGKRWWAFEFGDVIVVGLDTNVTRPQEFHDQIAFVREKMSGDFAYRFVIFHHPMFSSDAIYGPGGEGLQIMWHPVFVELGVDIVFNGHAHNYERIERDGVTYLVVGGSGARLRPLGPERVEGSRVAHDDRYFYVRVIAGPDGIQVEAVAVARQVDSDVVPSPGLLDAFILPKE